MKDFSFSGPFNDDAGDTVDLLEGLISPVPAQLLVAPPPASPPRTKPGESTPVTGSLATPPSQAAPRVAPDWRTGNPPTTPTRNRGAAASGRIRKGLASYLLQHPLNSRAREAARKAASERTLEPAILGAANQPQVPGTRDAASGRVVTQGVALPQHREEAQ